MRQGQQNRRGRGRNRKSQNPLTRSFESNGPDVKIRGTPSHIAEKYISLARDAQSSGDPVLSESYLQHAEHYNRIIMAFREQQIQQGGGDPATLRRQPGLGEYGDTDDLGEDGDDEAGGTDMGGIMGSNEPQPHIRNFEPQHRHERQERHERSEGNRSRSNFQNRQGGRDRHFNGRDGNDRRQGGEQDSEQPRREPREPREMRDRDQTRFDQSRSETGRSEPSRAEPSRSEQSRSDQGRSEQTGRRAGGSGEGRRREFVGSGTEQPEFLRRSVRRPRRQREEAEEGVAEATPAEDNAE
ncbi:MAG TPA: DUF4167 domain-containing protein [Hyphomicrobiaceae bacterium]|nr:DUF4167 domain-containing protein [Hyphomicrobiaceae bacterium]